MNAANTYFKFYDPFLTYSNRGCVSFIKPGGEAYGELDSGARELFIVGKNAFDYFSDCSAAEFFEVIASYRKTIDEFRNVMESAAADKNITFLSDLSGEIAIPCFKTMDDSDVVKITWQMVCSSKNPQDNLSKDLMKEVFFLLSLHEVENALRYLSWRDDGVGLAIASSIEAANALSNAMSICSNSEKEQEIRRNIAYRGAIAKLKRDPKQEAKRFVHECWLNWQNDPARYKSQAKFAKDMMEKCPELENKVSIENWCREWKRGVIEQAQ